MAPYVDTFLEDFGLFLAEGLFLEEQTKDFYEEQLSYFLTTVWSQSNVY